MTLKKILNTLTNPSEIEAHFDKFVAKYPKFKESVFCP